MIYRSSIFITGESYIPVVGQELQDYPLHIYSDWTKDDTYQLRGRCRPYGYGASQLLHDSVYAETEEDRARIIKDYIHFLEENIDVLKERGATEVELAVTVYMDKSKRFLLLTKQEMERLQRCGNIVVRLDILCLSKKRIYVCSRRYDYGKEGRKMKDYKARRTFQGHEKHMVYYLHSEKNIPCSLGWNSSELAQIVDEDRHLSIYVGWDTTRYPRETKKS